MQTAASPRRALDYRATAVIVILIWAVTPALLVQASQSFTSASLALLRNISSCAVLVTMACIKRVGLPKLRDVPYFAAIGFVAYALYMILFNTGNALGGAATTSMVMASGPVMVAVFASVVFKESLSWIRWAAIGVEAVGILLMTLLDGGVSGNIAILYLLAAAVANAAVTLVKRRPRGYDSLQFTTYSMVAGTLLMMFALPDLIAEVQAAPITDTLIGVYGGLVSSGLGNLWWAGAIMRAPKATDVTNFQFMHPFLGALMGWVINGAVPSNATMIGGMVIMTGVAIFNFGEFLLPRGKRSAKS